MKYQGVFKLFAATVVTGGLKSTLEHYTSANTNPMPRYLILASGVARIYVQGLWIRDVYPLSDNPICLSFQRPTNAISCTLAVSAFTVTPRTGHKFLVEFW